MDTLPTADDVNGFISKFAAERDNSKTIRIFLKSCYFTENGEIPKALDSLINVLCRDGNLKKVLECCAKASVYKNVLQTVSINCDISEKTLDDIDLTKFFGNILDRYGFGKKLILMINQPGKGFLHINALSAELVNGKYFCKRFLGFASNSDYEEGYYDEKMNKTGEWTTYTDTGIVLEKGSYENDKKTGEWNVYRHGKLLDVATYENDVWNGPFKNYYENSDQIQSTSFYKNGKLDGTYTGFHRNGRLRIEGSYENGTPIGEWKRWNEKGELEKTGTYEDVHSIAIGTK